MIGVLSILLALAVCLVPILILWEVIDFGYRPDSQDCGSGMSGVGWCDNSYSKTSYSGFLEYGIFFASLVVGPVIGLFGLFLSDTANEGSNTEAPQDQPT